MKENHTTIHTRIQWCAFLRISKEIVLAHNVCWCMFDRWLGSDRLASAHSVCVRTTDSIRNKSEDLLLSMLLLLYFSLIVFFSFQYTTYSFTHIRISRLNVMCMGDLILCETSMCRKELTQCFGSTIDSVSLHHLNDTLWVQASSFNEYDGTTNDPSIYRMIGCMPIFFQFVPLLCGNN